MAIRSSITTKPGALTRLHLQGDVYRWSRVSECSYGDEVRACVGIGADVSQTDTAGDLHEDAWAFLAYQFDAAADLLR